MRPRDWGVPLGAWRGLEARKWVCGGVVVSAEVLCEGGLCEDCGGLLEGVFMGIWGGCVGSGEELVW